MSDIWRWSATLPVALLVGCAHIGNDKAPMPRNIIVMIGDGMGPAQVTAYRTYADDPVTPGIDPLPMDRYLVGAVVTESLPVLCSPRLECEDAPYTVTDSAAGATAYSTGIDTFNDAVSVDPSGHHLDTLMEKARRWGKATGLVVTSQITHATPAAFAAHVTNRDDEADIADQMLDNRINGEPLVDVMLGGGRTFLQRDDRDVMGEFEGHGYQVVETSDELAAATGSRVLGVFADWGLPRSWDRDESVPSLAAMTKSALNILDQSEKGFVLMVEGSQIDWAGHGNDIVGVISEMEDFVAAVEVVFDFARTNGETLVVITADHETGGLSLSIDDVYLWDPRPLRGVSRTPARLTSDFLAGDRSLAEIVQEHVPFALSAAERATLNAAPKDEDTVYRAICDVFDARSRTGWSTEGHTGVDVPLYALGPGSQRFRGVMANEDVGKALRLAVER